MTSAVKLPRRVRPPRRPEQRGGRNAADGIVASVVLVLGLLYGFQSLNEGIGSIAETGAGFFPLVVAVILVASSGVVIWSELRQAGKPATPADEDDSDFEGDVHWWRIAGVLVAAFVVPIIGNTVGFVVTLSVIVVVVAKVMGLSGWRRPLLLGGIFGLAVWLIFVRWLFVPLPAGTIGLV